MPSMSFGRIGNITKKRLRILKGNLRKSVNNEGLLEMLTAV